MRNNNIYYGLIIVLIYLIFKNLSGGNMNEMKVNNVVDTLSKEKKENNDALSKEKDANPNITLELLGNEREREDGYCIFNNECDGNLVCYNNKCTKKKKHNKIKAVLPTVNNPFANILIQEYSKNQGRTSIINVDNPKIMNDVNNKFYNGLFRNKDDIFNKNNSQRSFFTNPVREIPNKQMVLAKWLYSTPPTCKENNRNQCFANVANFQADYGYPRKYLQATYGNFVKDSGKTDVTSYIGVDLNDTNSPAITTPLSTTPKKTTTTPKTTTPKTTTPKSTTTKNPQFPSSLPKEIVDILLQIPGVNNWEDTKKAIEEVTGGAYKASDITPEIVITLASQLKMASI